MYKNILLAVDGSENNSIAAKDAVCIAKSMGAKLTAVYVVAGADLKPNAFGGDVSASERADIAQKSANEAFKEVMYLSEKAGVELETITVGGTPANEIVKMSEEYDLIVCGSLGATGLSKMFMGSVSEALARHCKCSVLVSRRP